MTAILLVLFGTWIAFPGPTGAQQAARNDSDSLIAELRSPVWRVRDEATSTLMEKGTEIFDPLRREFNRTRSYETRRRIKDVAREVYLTDKLGPPMAFLGISHNAYDLRNVDEPRLEPGATALRIECVFPGTAADRAGIQPGDLLIAINGKRAMVEEPALNMTKWIASQKPGTPCKVGIIRGGRGFRIESTNQDFSFDRFSKLKLKPASAKESQLIPAGGAALKILEPVRVTTDITLQPGDFIVALNDQILTPENPQAAYERWLATISKIRSGGSGEEELRMNPNGVPQVVQKASASIQIIRGGERFDVGLRLGRRPAFLRSSVQPAWQIDPAAVEDAQNGFESWWTSFFDPTHSFVEQASADPAWRFESREPASIAR